MIVQLKFRKGTSDEWESVNPVLAIAEPAYDSTVDSFKIGDGVTAWNDLAYQTFSLDEVTALIAEVNANSAALATALANAGVATAAANAAAAAATAAAGSLGGGLDSGVAALIPGPSATNTALGAAVDIAVGEANTSVSADDRNRLNHTGTQSADTITDGTANKVYTAAEKIKLAGVATGATANATDAVNRSRSNHTGTQLLSTISDFVVEIRKTDANAFYAGGAYPTRASVTTDTARRVRWVGPSAPTIGGTGAITGLDVWETTS